MNETILNWKKAAIAWGEGREIEFRSTDLNTGYKCIWNDLVSNYSEVPFKFYLEYRIKPQAEEKPTVAETTSSSPKPKRFIRELECSIRDNENGELYVSYLKLAEVLNSLHEENEALKKENEDLTKEVYKTRKCYLDMRQELAQAKQQNEQLQMALRSHGAWDISCSNDKQATPAEKAVNTPPEGMICGIPTSKWMSFFGRLEKIEKALKEQLRIEL